MPLYKLLFSPESLKEIEAIVFYYDQKSNGLSKRFKSNLLAALNAIKANPQSRSFRYNNVRFAVVTKFPYAAHYTVDEQARIIKIQAVLGFKQDDKTNWKLRF